MVLQLFLFDYSIFIKCSQNYQYITLIILLTMLLWILDRPHHIDMLGEMMVVFHPGEGTPIYRWMGMLFIPFRGQNQRSGTF